MTSLDSFKCRKKLTVGAKTYHYFSLKTAEKNGLKGISNLPFSLKVLLENLLRFEDGVLQWPALALSPAQTAAFQQALTARGYQLHSEGRQWRLSTGGQP